MPLKLAAFALADKAARFSGAANRLFGFPSFHAPMVCTLTTVSPRPDGVGVGDLAASVVALVDVGGAGAAGSVGVGVAAGGSVGAGVAAGGCGAPDGADGMVATCSTWPAGNGLTGACGNFVLGT